jgi:hypothetical protein
MACPLHREPQALRNELFAPIKEFCDSLQKRVLACKRDEFEDDVAELFALCGKLVPFLQVASEQRESPAPYFSDSSFAMIRECDVMKYSTPASPHVFVNGAYKAGGTCSFPCSPQSTLDSRSKVFSGAVALLHRVLPKLYCKFSCPQPDNQPLTASHGSSMLNLDDSLEKVCSVSCSSASSSGASCSSASSSGASCCSASSSGASCSGASRSKQPSPGKFVALGGSSVFTPGAKKLKVSVSDEQMKAVRQQFEAMYDMKGCITQSTADFLNSLKDNGCVFIETDMNYCIQYGFAMNKFDEAPYDTWVAGFSSPRHEIKNHAVRTHVEAVVGVCCYALALEFHGAHTHLDNVQLSQLLMLKCPCMMCSIIRGLGYSSADTEKLSKYKFVLEKYLTICRNWTLQCLHLTLCSVTPIDVLQQMCFMFCKYRCGKDCCCAVPWKQAEEELLSRLETFTAMQTLSQTIFTTLCQVLCEAQAMHQRRLRLQKKSLSEQLDTVLSADAA